MRIRLTILITCILFGSGITMAQTNLWDTVRLAEARVIGQLKSISISSIQVDSVELQNNSGGDLATLLSRNAPVFIKTAAPGSLATISMRGTLASHTKVTWNGIQLNSPMLGQVDFTLIPTFLTDRVLISSGPGSILDGSGGLGGQINLASQGKWDKKIYGSLASSMGSFHTYKWMADVGGTKGVFQLRTRLYRTQSDNNFTFLNTANGLFNEVKQANADYYLQGLLLQLIVRPGPNALFSSDIWIQEANRNLPPIMSYEGTGRTEYQLDKSIRISGKGQFNKEKFDFKLSSGISLESLYYLLQHETGGGLLTNFNTLSASFINNNKISVGYRMHDKHQVMLGLNSDFHLVDILDEKTGSGYSANRFENGLSITADQKWTTRLKSYFSIQQSWIRTKRNPMVPGLGIAYSIIPEILDLKFSAARNYKLPTLNDLFWVPGGNPDLLPEQGYLGDLGIKTALRSAKGTHIGYELTGFASYIDNWILWRPGQFQYWSPENLEIVFARGLETSLDFSRHWEKSTIQLKAHYTYTLTNQLGSESRVQLMYIPKHKLTAFLLGESGNWYGHYNFRFTSERLTGTGDEASLHQLPAYSLHDFSLGRKISLKEKSLDIRLTINNLLNTDYQSILWRAMPGRNYNLILRFDF